MFARYAIIAALACVVISCESTEPCESGSGITLAITPRPASLERGQAVDLNGVVADRCGDTVAADIEWRSSAADVATVDDGGLVEALATGTTWVSAVAAEFDLTDSILIAVPAPAAVQLLITGSRVLRYIPPGVEWNSTNADTTIVVPSGLATTVIALAILDSGDTIPYAGAVTWSSSDPAIVSVDEQGNLRAEAAGSAMITLSAPGSDLPPASHRALATTGYTAVDIGFEAVALNDLGEVVGRSSTGALLWSGGATTPLGDWNPGEINSRGTIVGSADGAAVAWRNGVLDTLPSDGCGAAGAFGINEDDVIVGAIRCDGGAVRWVGDAVDTLGAGVALDINATGVIVGSRKWSDGEETILLLPNGTPAPGHGVNDPGQVVGDVAWQSGISCEAGYGILWSPDGAATIYEGSPDIGYPGYGGPNMRFAEINNEGVIVGARGGCHVFDYVVIHPGEPPIPLGMVSTSSPGRVSDPFGALGIDINDSGQIAVRTKLLTPIPF